MIPILMMMMCVLAPFSISNQFDLPFTETDTDLMNWWEPKIPLLQEPVYFLMWVTHNLYMTAYQYHYMVII